MTIRNSFATLAWTRSPFSLSLAIETKFGFKFEGTPKFNTVGEVLDYIGSHTTR